MVRDQITVKRPKEKIETKEEVEKEAQQDEALIVEQKEQNQSGFVNIFNSNIDFQCVGTQNNYEEQLNLLEACLAIPCLDEVCIEAIEMNVEDNMHDEEINEIFRYWSPKEMELYYGIMLQQINDGKSTTEDNMWQQSA